MRTPIVTLLMVLAVSCSALADKASHRKAALDVLEAANTRQMIDQMGEAIEGMMASQFKSMDLPPEGKEAAEGAQKEIMEWMGDFLDWEKMRDMYVDIYVDVFTEEELVELTQFYKSPLGRKLVEKMPELMQKSMQKTQAIMQKKMPELQQRIRKATQGIKEKYTGPSTVEEGAGVSGSSEGGKK